jgi:hypothetical protein
VPSRISTSEPRLAAGAASSAAPGPASGAAGRLPAHDGSAAALPSPPLPQGASAHVPDFSL